MNPTKESERNLDKSKGRKRSLGCFSRSTLASRSLCFFRRHCGFFKFPHTKKHHRRYFPNLCFAVGNDSVEGFFVDVWIVSWTRLRSWLRVLSHWTRLRSLGVAWNDINWTTPVKNDLLDRTRQCANISSKSAISEKGIPEYSLITVWVNWQFWFTSMLLSVALKVYASVLTGTCDESDRWGCKYQWLSLGLIRVSCFAQV